MLVDEMSLFSGLNNIVNREQNHFFFISIVIFVKIIHFVIKNIWHFFDIEDTLYV